MNIKTILFLFVCAFFVACKTETPKVAAPIHSKLPPVPEEFIVNAYKTIDHIDYLFRNTNFSVSQDEPDAIKHTISLLSPGEVSSVDPACKPNVRMTYLSQGNIMFDTEMYITENCVFVEYYIDNKKTYQSSFSEEGFNFLINIINSASSGRGG